MKDIEGDHYRILSKIGEGTYGTVYRAIDQRDNSEVALKQIRIRKVDDGLPKEFIREVESLKLVSHPYVISINEVFVGKSHITIVYPFCNGGDLCQKLENIRRPLLDEEINSIMRNLLAGLLATHSIGMMHRDLKPSNILFHKKELLEEPQLKICDFGQTRVVRHDIAYSIDVGTKWYKAPEILFGSRNYDEKVDMWSVGCIYAELLAGYPLFPGVNDID